MIDKVSSKNCLGRAQVSNLQDSSEDEMIAIDRSWMNTSSLQCITSFNCYQPSRSNNKLTQ